MEAQDPLSELADIHLPEAVSWWPPAPGWWLVALILLALIIFASRHALRRWQRRRHMQAALDELDQAWHHYLEQKALVAVDDEKAALALLQTINATLRRVALICYPEEDVAALSGQKWVEFLDQCDDELSFAALGSDGPGDSLYRRHYSGNPEPVYSMARRWIEKRFMKDSRVRLEEARS